MPNERKILLHIKSIQTDNNNEKSEMAFYAEGDYFEKGQGIYITYKESEISGMEGSTTTLKLEAGEISLIRFGSIATKLTFKKGRRTTALYHTGYGNFDMTIDTDEIALDMTKIGMSHIFLKYVLTIDHQEPLIQELYINYNFKDDAIS